MFLLSLGEQPLTLVEQSPTLVSEDSEFDSGSESPGEIKVWSDSEIGLDLR